MNEAARSMTRPRRVYCGWMVALYWSRCLHCLEVIDRGDWQGLARVPDHGPRWVHEACALELGPLGSAQRPAHDRGVATEDATEAATEATRPTAGTAAVSGAGSAVLRVRVVGAADWPRARATEVRDAIAAVVRGHRHARIAHAARTDPDTGRLAGVDAWAELTATRLGLQVDHLSCPARPDDGRRHPGEPANREPAQLVDLVDVVVAFPLTRDPATGRPRRDPATEDAIAAAELAGLVVLVHGDPHRA
ncbi:hypothetical protein [Actinomycetospora soli]|uniref:hypothetical protein n=1 Tax=Actinomycetospora soli TaxID=2893887 RepID=UPI001E4E9BBC|nr:hypothetical protein [Actinomycetospora soli]MCD2191302.1 hypothetical protein [Actinomycetospora soli]